MVILGAILLGFLLLAGFVVVIGWSLSLFREPELSPYERWANLEVNRQPYDHTPIEDVEAWRGDWDGRYNALEQTYTANYRALRDEQEQAAIAEAQRQQDLREAVVRDFPEWLRSLGQSFGVTSYGELGELRLYIEAILSYGQQEFEGGLPIRKMYQANQDRRIARPPNLSCESRAFFEELSRALLRAGALRTGKGNKPNTISDDYHRYLSN